MFRYTNRPSLAALLAAALLLSTFAPLAAFAGTKRPAPRQKKEENKDKDKKKDEKEEKPKLTKAERKYQEIKKFSAELYNKDADFRDTVDDAYERKMREHTEFAFDLNTRNGLDQVKRDGDKLKIYDALYDNPLAQDYVNRLGQSLVPASTTKLYAFKITLNPIPEAKSLATGTVYISSGLLSKVDNEAQLAYILGHEIGHIEKEHWFEDTLVSNGVNEFNEKQQKKRAIWGAVIGAATAGVAGAAGGDALNAGLLTGLVIAPTLLKFVMPNAVNSWDRLQEDEADQLGLKYMLDRNYDPREVPKFYASMQRSTRRDKRAALGFMADPQRMNERIATVNLALAGLTLDPTRILVGAMDLANAKPNAPPPSDNPTKSLDASNNAAARAAAADRTIGTQLAAEIKQKLDAGELIGSGAEFESVMAALKRDNGIRAYYYDMFQMARDNLEESLLIRSNDPFTHFYYGKVLKLTARNATEKSRALAEFVRAIELDKRRVLPEARLHRALALIENKESSQMPEIVSTLKEYVNLYQRQNGGQLPPNMEVIYDYMQEANEMTWSVPPVTNISTKNIEPVSVSSSAGGARPADAAPAASTPATTRSPQPASRQRP
ncbi:MAG TPA: M48 family metallopeptidase [Pyrinomonadaceae bacterium]|nr:M48 family metallopeptidase [Pyrinomonadaceae bacterium]